MATMRIAQLQRAWRATSCLERLLCSTSAACGAHAALELSQPWGKARSHYFVFKILKFDWENVLVGWMHSISKSRGVDCIASELKSCENGQASWVFFMYISPLKPKA